MTAQYCKTIGQITNFSDDHDIYLFKNVRVSTHISGAVSVVHRVGKKAGMIQVASTSCFCSIDQTLELRWIRILGNSVMMRPTFVTARLSQILILTDLKEKNNFKLSTNLAKPHPIRIRLAPTMFNLSLLGLIRTQHCIISYQPVIIFHSGVSFNETLQLIYYCTRAYISRKSHNTYHICLLSANVIIEFPVYSYINIRLCD